jgi:magnesium chelatase accessory protein
MARLMARQARVPRLFARRASDTGAVQRMVAATGSTLDAQGLALYARLMRSPAHVAAALAMMADWDLDGLWTDLPGLAVPLTLLVGGQDSTVPPVQAQRVRLKLPSTQVHQLDGLGHLAHEEAPQRVAEALAALGLAGAVRRPPRRAA